MKRRHALTVLAGLLVGTSLQLAPTSPAEALSASQFPVRRVSVVAGGVDPAVPGEASHAAVSLWGRYATFATGGRMVPGDTDSVVDVYLKDRLTDEIERVSATVDGAPATGPSTISAVSADGRYVAFTSVASNLVPGDSNDTSDVFVRDTVTDTTERVSVTSSEQQASGQSPASLGVDTIDISNDGRYVVFSSRAANLGADANTSADIFLRDRTAGTTELVSLSDADQPVSGWSAQPNVSDDGRYVSFDSTATTLLPTDTNGGRDVYLRDRQTGSTTRVSLHDNDVQVATGESHTPRMSGNGNVIVFVSTSKLNPNDANVDADVYARIRATTATYVASVGADGKAVGASSADPGVSPDGSTWAFSSASANVLPGNNGVRQLYLRRNGVTTRISVRYDGKPSTGTAERPALSSNAEHVLFETGSSLRLADPGRRDIYSWGRPSYGGSFDDEVEYAHSMSKHFGGELDPMALAIADGASPQDLAVARAMAPERVGKAPALIRLYVAYFRRLPDKGGMDYWMAKLAAGRKLDQVSASFAGSSEFKTKYGNTTNTQFVELVYQNVLGREAEPGGLAFWVKKLDGGMSRGTVMTNFSESSEGRRKFSLHVHATILSLGMVGTIPTGEVLQELLAADSPEEQVLLIAGQSAYHGDEVDVA